MRSQVLSALARRTRSTQWGVVQAYAPIPSRQLRSFSAVFQSSPLTARSRAPTICLKRFESTASPAQRPLTDRSDTPKDPNPEREEVPSYQMTFTCRKCLERSSHKISKQAYHHGTTLITCPGCKNRHLISDHLKIFSDKSITLEDILREKGQMLKKGALDAEGNVEFWEDGTQGKKGD